MAHRLLVFVHHANAMKEGQPMSLWNRLSDSLRRTPTPTEPPPQEPSLSNTLERVVEETLRPDPLPDDGTVRFACDECGRGLRVPSEIIGRKVSCPFCRTVFATAFAPEDTALAPVPEIADQAAAVPGPKSHFERARGLIKTEHAKAAAAAVGKFAARAATPLAPIATGAASAFFPGAGEIIGGRPLSGVATVAAFLGATVAAGTTGGAWVAVPIAIRIVSAVRGAALGAGTAADITSRLEQQHQEARDAAERLAKEAALHDEQEIERLMAQREQEELARIAAGQAGRKVILTRIQS